MAGVTGTGASGDGQDSGVMTGVTGTGASGDGKDSAVMTGVTGTGASGDGQDSAGMTGVTGTGASGDGQDSAVMTGVTGTGASGDEQDSGVMTGVTGTGASGDGQDNAVMTGVTGTGASGDGQDSAVMTGVTGTGASGGEVVSLCPTHARPFVVWCNWCKEFSCSKCVVKKQNLCTFVDFEDSLPNIQDHLSKKIEQTTSVIQSNADNLHAEQTKYSNLLSSVNTKLKFLNKFGDNFKARSKRPKKLKIKKIENVNGVLEMIAYLKTLEELQQQTVVPITPVPMTPMSDMVQQDQTAGSSPAAATAQAAATARAAVWLWVGGVWTADVSNWRAAVLAMEQRQPRHLILRAARDRVPEAFPADAVATIAGAARDCEVWAYFLDTYFKPEKTHTDSQRLQHILANTSLRLTVFFGHLDPAGIARLPPSVARLGLAIGSAGDAAAVSGMTVWEGLVGLDVAVSVGVAPQDLRPLPRVPRVPLLYIHFYGISDTQVDLIRPAIDALVPDKRIERLCLPKCQLSACGARRLAHQLRGFKMSGVGIDASGLWRSGEEERNTLSGEFHSAVDCGVGWGMKWLLG